MIVRDLPDGSSLLILQEDHAELSAQFAAHWGNDEFAKLDPYESMVFATTYHDSGHRDWEGAPPINVEKGRPYGHRETPFSPDQLVSYARNVEWVGDRDPFAGVMISMHRTGLWQNRYETISSPRATYGARPQRPEVQTAIEELERAQQTAREALSKEDDRSEDRVWYNYRLLQVYDIFSLYFCLDGHTDDGLTEQLVAPVPVAYGKTDEVELHIVPTGPSSVRITPYPLDVSPLQVSVRGRVMQLLVGKTEDEIRESYHKAERCVLNFTVSA